jgi:hypothetical protein
MKHQPNRGKLEAATREAAHLVTELYQEFSPESSDGSFTAFEIRASSVLSELLEAAELLGRSWAANELKQDASTLKTHFDNMPERLKREKCACIPAIVKDMKRQSARYLVRSDHEADNS